MLDFMNYCLQQYYKTFGWTEQNYYSSLSSASDSILNFETPHGLGLRLGKPISPLLFASYSLGLPSDKSIGFLFSSLPLKISPLPLVEKPWPISLPFDLEDSITVTSQETTGTLPETNHSHLSNPEALAKLAQQILTWTHSRLPTLEEDYLLYGRLDQDFSLEGLYSRRLLKSTFLVVSGTNSWSTPASSIHTQLLHNSSRWCGELSYTSEDHIFGLSGLYRFLNSGWAVGGELYYTARERSGGLSLGARYSRQYAETAHSVMSFVCNPMMGHLSATYTATVRPHLDISTRYDLNVFSFESDVSAGLEYSPIDKAHVFKTSVSLAEGFAVKFESRFHRLIASVGLKTGFQRHSMQSLGLELQFC
ncbi:uncharacterized protein BJ171DRAFT_93152 [Polychytrium aggregatum]|uniref:uncharacterized protein n=1 Tax=Polychytrium aggregatum TaxID=110093 RepID=UPI0022FE371D|nr:uncharacterized protein BJ171DRAFT_93152 [Polychytrium aggregatum]KAI9204962.1 hypothetical protein BJ171DRAFT_93152 [Polychytrium aggregatum]